MGCIQIRLKVFDPLEILSGVSSVIWTVQCSLVPVSGFKDKSIVGERVKQNNLE